MPVYITDKLRITRLDKRCLQLEELKTIKPKDKPEHNEWVWVGYFGDLRSALHGAYKTQVLDAVGGSEALEELIKKIEESENNVVKAIEKI